MLTKIGLTNFKCFRRATLNSTPLNLLCGLNGMGKSSLIQSLLVLRQSFETGELTNGRLVIGGRHADLGTGSDVLFEDAEHDEIGFSLESRETKRNWELYFAYSRESDLLSVAQASSNSHLPYVPGDWQTIPPFGGNLVYVNAERVGPRKFYPISDVLARRGDFGPGGEFTWNFLSRHGHESMSTDDPRLGSSGRRQLQNVVDDWLQEVSPGAHLELERIPAADALVAGFTFDRPGDVGSGRHRATNVGFGLSYVLPVIVSLLSESGTLCLIENPESHLHPRGQTKLAELAARSSRAGMQIFVETHSDHFMDGVRIAVRDGLLRPEDVSIHFFERDGTRSVVTSPEIDAEGRLSRWPAGFFDQHEMNLVRLLQPRS